MLITKLKSSSPADTLIVTSIQKMSNIKESRINNHDIELINKKRIVFIVVMLLITAIYYFAGYTNYIILINSAIAAGGISLNDFLKQREETEKAYLDQLIRTPLGEKAYRQKYSIPDDVPIENYINNGTQENIPDRVFLGFYDQDNDQLYNSYNELMNRNVRAVPEQDAHLLNDDTYNYADYFNF